MSAPAHVVKPELSGSAEPSKAPVQFDLDERDTLDPDKVPDSRLFGLLEQFLSLSTQPYGSKEYNQSDEQHMNALQAEFDDTYIDVCDLFRLLVALYRDKPFERQSAEVIRISERLLYFMLDVLEPSLWILWHAGMEEANIGTSQQVQPEETIGTRSSNVAGRDIADNNQEGMLSKLAIGEEYDPSGQPVPPRSLFNLLCEFKSKPHLFLVYQVSHYFYQCIHCIIEYEPNRYPNMVGLRHRHGLLRREQIQLVEIALDTLMHDLDELCKLCSSFRKTPEYRTPEGIEEASKLCGKFIAKITSVSTLFNGLLVNASFRSERLEVLLLRYIHEDGGEAGFQVASELRRRHEPTQMVHFYQRVRCYILVMITGRVMESGNTVNVGACMRELARRNPKRKVL
ncbi:hypothetical protein BJ508DRAFT_305948 [Ascobolus immersus RN42]|uniref:Uncharacterized protein n=1 Tax=Ascobolus immersus RN42 TaxID=1160509 RepID=A0A3N4IK87_ASCIM|nr:hypothetical protein BJ508DRAFT_305948 [Ascobolus immersus RN42]